MEHSLREEGRIRPTLSGGADRPHPVAEHRCVVLLWASSSPQAAGDRCSSRRT